MAGDQQAIQNATRLSEIGFPEFTAKLINDTFNAITASYIQQTAQYMSLVQAVSQTLKDYINNTRDDIGILEINAFLVAIRDLNDSALNFLLGDPATSPQLSAAEATAINDATALPPAAGSSSAPASAGALTASKRTTIAEAIARRIACNKYDLLQTMVRQGILRLYVDNGTIETRLTFSTYGQAFSSSETTNRDQAFNLQTYTGVGGTWLTASPRTVGTTGTAFYMGGGAGAGSYAGGTFSLNVSTANATQRDVSGSSVQIFGRVVLNIKTDLLPLTSAPPP